MTTRELFKRRVIELIHGLPYEEAVEKELIDGCKVNARGSNMHVYTHTLCKGDLRARKEYGKYYLQASDCCAGCCKGFSDIIVEIIGLPITIGRVMQAIRNRAPYDDVDEGVAFDCERILLEVWKLTKENGQECTDDDQTDETIEKLYELIK